MKGFGYDVVENSTQEGALVEKVDVPEGEMGGFEAWNDVEEWVGGGATVYRAPNRQGHRYLRRRWTQRVARGRPEGLTQRRLRWRTQQVGRSQSESLTLPVAMGR